MEVYLDVLIVLNFLINFLLLKVTARLTGAFLSPWRLIAGAAVGAIYAGATVMPGLSFLGNNLWRGVFLGLMAVTAFGFRRATVKKAGLLLGLSFLLGGIALALGLRGFWPLVIGGVLAAIAAVLFFSGALKHAGELVPARIRLGEREISLTALRDSGNTLSDPFTGEGVLVVGAAAAGRLLGQVDLKCPAQAVAGWRGAGKPRLLPYRALGGQGVLLAVRCDGVTLAGKPAGTLVAFSPEELAPSGQYEALTGGGFYG